MEGGRIPQRAEGALPRSRKDSDRFPGGRDSLSGHSTAADKGLERGAWAPPPAAAAAAARDTPGDPSCAICRGVGSIANPGGLSGRLCECYLRKHSAKPSPEAPEPAAL